MKKYFFPSFSPYNQLHLKYIFVSPCKIEIYQDFQPVEQNNILMDANEQVTIKTHIYTQTYVEGGMVAV